MLPEPGGFSQRKLLQCRELLQSLPGRRERRSGDTRSAPGVTSPAPLRPRGLIINTRPGVPGCALQRQGR